MSEDREPAFEVGDAVMLKSGGPSMRVGRPDRHPETGQAGFLCSWEADGGRREHWFPGIVLAPADRLTEEEWAAMSGILVDGAPIADATRDAHGRACVKVADAFRRRGWSRESLRAALTAGEDAARDRAWGILMGLLPPGDPRAHSPPIAPG